MTPAEKLLWMHLKSGVNGLKFRRQHPLGNYIADFYCHKIKLIIEADGKIHNVESVKSYDNERKDALASSGYTVIRFSNDQIEKKLDAVLAEIIATVRAELQKLNNE